MSNNNKEKGNIFREITKKEEAKAGQILYAVIQEKYKHLPAQERNAILEKYSSPSPLYNTGEYPFTRGNVVDYGSVNAFTHAYTAAKMSRNPLVVPFTVGAAFLKEFASYVTDDRAAAWNNNVPLMNFYELDHNRDWHNNFFGIGKGFGRIFASDKQMARSIFDAMERGELITDLKDPQKRVGLPKFWARNVYDLVEQRESEYYRNKKFNLDSGAGASGNHLFKLRFAFNQAKTGAQNFFGGLRRIYDASYGELVPKDGAVFNLHVTKYNEDTHYINNEGKIQKIQEVSSDPTIISSYINDFVRDGYNLPDNIGDLPADFRQNLLAQYNRINEPKTFRQTLMDKLGIAKDFIVEKGLGIAMGLSSMIGGVQGLVQIIKNLHKVLWGGLRRVLTY